jgi:hypothetical protein
LVQQARMLEPLLVWNKQTKLLYNMIFILIKTQSP